MAVIIKGDQRTPEWRAARLGLATASNFAAVMAKGRDGEEATTRRNYRIALALETLTGVPHSQDLSFSKDVANGVEREPLLKMNYEIATGSSLQEVAFVRHDTMPYGASPDGLLLPNGGIEGKCPAQAAHHEYLRLVDSPPSAYKWQVHGLILIADLQWVDFVSFNPDFPEPLQLHIVRVHRDEKLLAELRDGLERFTAEVSVTVREMRDMATERLAA